jgi:hypothetical protein
MGVMMVGFTSVSQANNFLANISAFSNTSPTDFVFTGGLGGTLSTSGSGFEVASTGPSTSSSDAIFELNPITEAGVATPDGFGGYNALFSGGTFSIVDDLGAGPTLLSGSFGSAVLTSPDSTEGTVVNLGLNTVTYNASSTYVQQFIAMYGGLAPITGNMTLALANATPGIGPDGTDGGFAAFDAQGGTSTFNAIATPAPELSPVVPFSMGVLALVGLMVVARRRTGLQF